MLRLQSLIDHAAQPGVVDSVGEDVELTPAAARIALLNSLDRRAISGRSTYLGPGGASATFNAAVQQALRDEIADQLRGQVNPHKPEEDGGGYWSEIGRWASDIVAAFREAE